jgi:hypothetical protein
MFKRRKTKRFLRQFRSLKRTGSESLIKSSEALHNHQKNDHDSQSSSSSGAHTGAERTDICGCGAVRCSDHYHAAASPRTQQQPALRTARGQVHTHSARPQATSAHPLPTHISLPLSAVSASRSGSFSRCVRMCTQRVVSE